MRSEDQVKRKLFELNQQLAGMKARLSEEALAASPQVAALDNMILMLEWVLDAPTGSYHQK